MTMAAESATERTLAIAADNRNKSLKYMRDIMMIQPALVEKSSRIHLLVEKIMRLEESIAMSTLHVVRQGHRRYFHGELTIHGIDGKQGIWKGPSGKESVVGRGPLEERNMTDRNLEGISHLGLDHQHLGEGALGMAVDLIRQLAGLLPDPPPKPPWPPPDMGSLRKVENINNIISTNKDSVINSFLDVTGTTFSSPDQELALQISGQILCYLNSRYYNFTTAVRAIFVGNSGFFITCGRVDNKRLLQCNSGVSSIEQLDARARMDDFALASQAKAQNQDAPPRITRVVGRSV